MPSNKKHDDLSSRMKGNYEMRSRTYLPRRTYTILRLDGKAFHSYTRGLKKPFDKGLIEDMEETMKFLCQNIQGCVFGYHQSDEISLLLTDFQKLNTDAWFDGQVQKICSVAASFCTAEFNSLRSERDWNDWSGSENDPPPAYKPAYFDCRVFTIPDRAEVMNYFRWRQKDAVKNSISMVAQSLYSPKELHGKNGSEQQELIYLKGQNWNDYPSNQKRGNCCVKSDGSYHLREYDFSGDYGWSVLKGLVPENNNE